MGMRSTAIHRRRRGTDRHPEIRRTDDDFRRRHRRYRRLSTVSFFADTSEDSFGGFIDNVTLVMVPEPTTIGVLGVSLMGLHFCNLSDGNTAPLPSVNRFIKARKRSGYGECLAVAALVVRQPSAGGRVQSFCVDAASASPPIDRYDVAR